MAIIYLVYIYFSKAYVIILVLGQIFQTQTVLFDLYDLQMCESVRQQSGQRSDFQWPLSGSWGII